MSGNHCFEPTVTQILKSMQTRMSQKISIPARCTTSNVYQNDFVWTQNRPEGVEENTSSLSAAQEVILPIRPSGNLHTVEELQVTLSAPVREQAPMYGLSKQENVVKHVQHSLLSTRSERAPLHSFSAMMRINYLGRRKITLMKSLWLKLLAYNLPWPI